ncbi:MAG: ImmA/IrrE family metallo-endopeptidase [Endomicrobium sp.]|jgi:Zn-dependent peptidase ImmA (M78 family)|nr:ImmA/IrrE family metallo-endopeptidase [Endomicrobium sp.]
MPVPLVGVAKDIVYGVCRFRSTFETLNISGTVNCNERKILLNEADFDMRQRFMLAREIGHIVLKHHKNGKSERVDYREDSSNPGGGGKNGMLIDLQ